MDFEALRKAIDNSSATSSIYVGCDSKKRGPDLVFVSTVVIHYDSNKGGVVFKEVEIEPYKAIYPKLQGEIYRIADLALKVKEWIGDRLLRFTLILIRRNATSPTWRIKKPEVRS